MTTVAVVGTGTEVGKTFVSAAVLTNLAARGVAVSARKPAQSFAADDPGPTDADVLGAATNEPPARVCPRHRWLAVPMAPPMAADALGREAFTVAELVAELGAAPSPVVTFVETAGGLRSPIADDGDCLDYVAALVPDAVVLVADAGLGTINAVRLCRDAVRDRLPHTPFVVCLNRYDGSSELHRRNARWLAERDGMDTRTSPADLAAGLVRMLRIPVND